MGVWGHGLFDNDYALDFIDPIIRKLMAQIVFYLSDESMSGLAPLDYGAVLAAADMLFLWYEHYNTSVFVEKKVVRRWREIYLQRFYEQNHTGDAAYRRLDVIETVFNRLEAAAWDDE